MTILGITKQETHTESVNSQPFPRTKKGNLTLVITEEYQLILKTKKQQERSHVFLFSVTLCSSQCSSGLGVIIFSDPTDEEIGSTATCGG